MAERARIARYFAPLAEAEPGSFQLTDDAAVLTLPVGQQLVITTDSVIENIHILSSATPMQFAQKLVRRNLSDLAAMGAKPWRYTLNLHTPRDLPENWFAEFAAALNAEQTHFNMVLAGGDSTSGATAIHATMTCFGLTDAAPLRRANAQVGDDIYVSGTLGDAAYALQLLQQNQPIDDMLRARYYAPTPRLQLGQLLRNTASAAADISDGLFADLQQICTASQCGALIELMTLPLSPMLQQHHRYDLALGGGDDYELCFTAPAPAREKIASVARLLDLPLTRIGSVCAGEGVTVLDGASNPITPTHAGYEHH